MSGRRKEFFVGQDGIAGGFDGDVQVVDMLVVARLKDDAQVARVDVGALAVAFVVDGDDVGAVAADDVAEAEERTRAVGHLDEHLRGASALEQTAVDDAAEDGHVDVAAADDAAHVLAGDVGLVEHGGGHAHGAGALGHEFVAFDEGQDGGANLVLADGDDLIDVGAAELEGVHAGLLDGDTVGDGQYGGEGLYLVVVAALHHAGGAAGLHADDADGGFEGLEGIGHAAGQSAAADGHEHHVDVGVVGEDFHTDGALSGDDLLVVEGVDEGHVALLVELQGAGVGIVIDAGHEAYLGAHGAGGLDLTDGCAGGHADEGRYAGALCGEGHALSMVAGRAGNDAVGFLFVGELRYLEAGAAHLERTGHLQVFGFEEHLAGGVDLGRGDERRMAHHVVQQGGGLVNDVEGEHVWECVGERCLW